MTENAVYLVSEEVARRAGVHDVAYVTKDGRFVIDLADFKRIRLTPEEYITGITGVERITAAESRILVSDNHYRRARDIAAAAAEEQEAAGETEATEAEGQQEQQEQQEEE